MPLIRARARLASGFGVARRPMLPCASLGWIAAFSGFALVFAPRLLTQRA